MESVWRDISFENGALQKKNKSIIAYKPPGDIETSNILLLGRVAHGKTSFVKTAFEAVHLHASDSIRQPGLSQIGCAVSTGKSVTKEYRGHRFKDEAGNLLGFRLCDTMGFEDCKGISQEDIYQILAGHIEQGYTFGDGLSICKSDKKYRKKPELKHRIHCVAVCVDANQVYDIDKQDPVIQRLINVKRSCVSDQGMAFNVLLTKIDDICERTQNNTRDALRSRRVHDAVKKASIIFGIPEVNVFPVRNYTSQTKYDYAIEVMALYVMERLLRDASAYIEAMGDDWD